MVLLFAGAYLSESPFDLAIRVVALEGLSVLKIDGFVQRKLVLELLFCWSAGITVSVFVTEDVVLLWVERGCVILCNRLRCCSRSWSSRCSRSYGLFTFLVTHGCCEYWKRPDDRRKGIETK